MPFGRLDGLLVTRIRMPDNTHTGVDGQNTFQPFSCRCSAIGYDHLPGVLAEANPHPAAVMKRNPGGTVDGVDERI